MCLSFNPYSYETAEEVENHLGIELMDILIYLNKNGYIVQQQFQSLDGYICESYSSMLTEIFSKRINKNVEYVYVKPAQCYAFFIPDMIDSDKVIEHANVEYKI